MTAKYVYRKDVSDKGRVMWTEELCKLFVLLWNRGESAAKMAKHFGITRSNVRKRKAILLKDGWMLKSRGNKTGAINMDSLQEHLHKLLKQMEIALRSTGDDGDAYLANQIAERRARPLNGG